MKILIIDGAKEFISSKGKLNEALVEYAVKSLKEKGHEVQVTKADSNYNCEEEVKKIVWTDVLLWQFPIWWFGTPWHVKKYRVSKGAFSTALYMRLLKEIYADYKYIIKNMNICI
ncbi:Modulator of drug activity B, putative [Trichomonas vaginalis G3]|uniref:Modulator of drug activity B, putative n=1 Tax=Trichomonas vaginalis (strain ATCC PRA-98 / G3) TaxID=412133 RepID=A2GSF8_TRIV3|nr:flavodoxin-like fold [Trichomonas vaginalis G3]EAX79909.1 Modulator of drug activity B, putative [Trichomonas vaginalis G3]KAI5538148.1 flavodoxin-like fold [Trichomonas vaginalis G3]|eukprot:XP_001292839.1 Modulator of drug activity B [Trichomonas vaginalis G3]